MVEGWRPAVEAAAAGAEARTLVTLEGARMGGGGECFGAAKVIRASGREAERAVGKDAGGVVAEFAMPRNCAETGWPEGWRRLLVLDAVQDPGNAGALVRTALALGWDAALFLPGSADPFNCKAVRGGRAAQLALPVGWARGEERSAAALRDAIEARGSGAVALVARPDGQAVGEVAQRFRDTPVALVVCNEGRGPSEELAGEGVAVPMAGGADSLNVAVAGGVLMFGLR